MFFSVSQTVQENFSNFYQLGPFCVGTDSGWSSTDIGQYHCVYKGYVDSMEMTAAIDQIVRHSEPTLLGNFCVIVYNSDTGQLDIKSDRYRNFPLYFGNGKVSNLHQLENTAWTDSLISIASDFSITESKFDVIGHIDTSYITIDKVFEKIDHLLQTKTEQFLKHNCLPIRTFLSGGVDSLLVYSYLQKFTDNFELINYQHIDYDEFWLKNSGTLTKFWGYNQIHHWNTPCVLTSGAYGDEFMLRGGTTVNMFLRSQGYSIPQLLDRPEWKQCSQYTYYTLDKNRKIFNNTDPLPEQDRHAMMWNVCNILVNDWQHWHLGQTLTWTPLRDLDMIKLLLRLPPEQAFGQLLNSDISRQLIEKNKPGLTRVLSDQKNMGNDQQNLVDFLCNKT